MTSPQMGDVGVVASPGFVGWAIRLVTRAPVNHAFVYVGAGRVVEGWQTGARYNDTTNYPSAAWLTNLSATLTDEQRTQISAYAVAHIGTPYSWVDDAEIGFVDVFGWAPKWMRKRLASDATLQCAQLCDAAYLAAAAHLFADGRAQGGVSPGDLWKLNFR